jgi:hypothetical protein
MVRHHLELAIGQALPAVRTLKASRLSAKDVQNVHEFFPTPNGVSQTSKPDSAASA